MGLRESSSPRGVLAEIRRLVVRMAVDNPTWYTRIQGAPFPSSTDAAFESQNTRIIRTPIRVL